MMMNPNILNKNPLMFFDRAVNAQRSQLLTVMADAVSECRTAADQAAELNETGQMGLLRLAEVWSTIRAKEGMGGLVLEGTEAKILSDVVAQFYAYLSGCMFNDPVGMAIYGYEVYNWLAQNAYRYGFIYRYPENKVAITGIANEPWHYRYVGVNAATEIYKRGICLEEYLGETN